MSFTTTNMSLVVPSVLVDIGPTYATEINNALVTIDAHNHASGSGVQINPSGLNINADLTFNNNNATNLRTARLYNESSITLGVNDKTCLYALNNELYYVDGAGNNVQVTSSGSLNLGSVSAITIKDSLFVLQYFGDTSRQARFSVANVPASTTRIYTLPTVSANDTLASLTATQTLTATTLTGGVVSGCTAATLISGSGTLTLNTSGTMTVPNGTDTIVGLALTQTLTNKILTGNTIASFTPNGGTNTLTVPAATSTLATLAAQTFTGTQTFAGSVQSTYEDFYEVSTPSAPASGYVRLYAKSGDALYYQTSGGTEKVITTGTAITYSQGDTATASTITALSSSTSMARLTGSTATTLQGIAAGTSGQVLTVYNVSSAIVEIANQNSSATAENRIITASGANTPLYPGWIGYFIYDNSQSRWILGPTTDSQVWQSYTPSIGSGAGTISNNSAYYKVVGDSLMVNGSFTTGTVTSGFISISIPSGFTISSSKLALSNTTSGAGNIVGTISGPSTYQYANLVSATGTSTTLVYASGNVSNGNLLVPGAASSNFGGSNTTCYSFTVPLV